MLFPSEGNPIHVSWDACRWDRSLNRQRGIGRAAEAAMWLLGENEPFLQREETMAVLKISSLLAVYALVACQMENGQAVPLRAGFEPVTDRDALGDYEARRLLNALVKEYVQMTAEDPDQASEGSSLDRPISKRCANLSTCVLGKLSQELHKLQTYPRTDVGAGTPGKKRNVLSELENERYANY